jgi:hypothetical protein
MDSAFNPDTNFGTEPVQNPGPYVAQAGKLCMKAGMCIAMVCNPEKQASWSVKIGPSVGEI